VGERLVIGRGVVREFASERERQIIGVVGDTTDGGLNLDPGPAMFIPQAQVPDAANALNVGLGPTGWGGAHPGSAHGHELGVLADNFALP
jgi:putative ABC transport system permease protein